MASLTPVPGKRRPIRRRTAAGLAAFLLLAAGLTAVREPLTTRLAHAYASRRLVRLWGLPETPEILALFRRGFREPPRPVFDRERLFEGPPGPTDRPAPFSRRYTHEDLYREGAMHIGVFTEDPVAREALRRWLDAPAPLPDGVHMHLRETRDEFIEALATLDMVIFFGHANLGRGLQLGNTGDREHWLPLAPPVLEMAHSDLRPGEEVIEELPGRRVRIRGGHAPELSNLHPRCRVFWLLGCRTDHYYRAWFEQHQPDIDLVLTLYELDTTTYAVQTLRTVLAALEERRPIHQAVDAMNRGRTLELLRGMRMEVTRYGADTAFPPGLHTADTP